MPKNDPAGYLPNVQAARRGKKKKKKGVSAKAKMMAQEMAEMKKGKK